VVVDILVLPQGVAGIWTPAASAASVTVSTTGITVSVTVSVTFSTSGITVSIVVSICGFSNPACSFLF